MHPDGLERMLFDSASEVLETMFFTTPNESAEPAADGLPSVSAHLTFHGSPSGRFGVSVPVETGRNISANFLGIEESELDEQQIGEVVCELANMVCGSILSRLESNARFELRHPELYIPEPGTPERSNALCRSFDLDPGSVTVWLDLDAE
jgi:CheY-specific phosphatase CheX